MNEPVNPRVTDEQVVDALATFLGTQKEWSGADCLEAIANMIGAVRPHPGNRWSTYLTDFYKATGRFAPEGYVSEDYPQAQTWTFFGHWDNDEIVIEYVRPGEHDDDREDAGFWEQGLFAASASGRTEQEALDKLRAEYE